jgi:hypothetical protein
MTNETPLLLALRDKLVAPNIFDRKFSVDFSKIDDWFTEYVDLVAPDGLVFFTDRSLCGGRAGAGVFFDILNVTESYSFRGICSHMCTSTLKIKFFFSNNRSVLFKRLKFQLNFQLLRK